MARGSVLRVLGAAEDAVTDRQHAPPVRLFRVSIKDKKVARLSENNDRIDALFLSPWPMRTDHAGICQAMHNVMRAGTLGIAA